MGRASKGRVADWFVGGLAQVRGAVYCVLCRRGACFVGTGCCAAMGGGLLSHVRGVDRLYGLAGSSGGCPVLGVTPYTCTLCWTLSRSWYPVVWPAVEGGDMGGKRKERADERG